MKKSLYLTMIIVFLAFSLNALAQDDVVKVSPKNNKVLVDNKYVRVVQGWLAPGEKEPMHHHPGMVVRSLTTGTVRFTMKDGTTKEQTMKAGETSWRDAVDHETENIGTTMVKYLLIEVKAAKM